MRTGCLDLHRGNVEKIYVDVMKITRSERRFGRDDEWIVGNPVGSFEEQKRRWSVPGKTKSTARNGCGTGS